MTGTKYPAKIDTNVEIPLSTDNVTPVKSEVPNVLRGAILAIETELGIDPSREFATVRARLDSMQAAIAGQSSIIGGLNPNRIVISDSAGNLSTQIPLLGIQYAVFMENPIGTMTWSSITQDMIAPSFAITFSSSQSTILEVGQTLTTPAFTATYNRTPSSVILTDNQGSPPKDVTSTPTSFNSNASATKNTVNATDIFTLTAINASVTKTSNITFTWEQKNYSGIGTAGQNSAAFILSLTGVLSPVLANTFTVNPGANQYIYFACRAAYTTPTFTVGGFSGGFNLVSNSISVTNSHGFNELYQLWVSTNSNLGLTTVVVT